MAVRLFDSDMAKLDLECGLCHKLHVKPTALNECLHTYCETCIISHVKTSTKCPKCALDYGPTIQNHLKFDSVLDSFLQKIIAGSSSRSSQTLKRKSTGQHFPKLHTKKPANIQILIGKTISITTSRNPSQAYESPISPQEALYLFGLEPAIQDSKQFLECPELKNPILKSKASTTIRQIQKHLRKHLWPDQDINLEDIYIYYNSKFLGPEWSIEYIARTLWKNSRDPMIFNYSLKKNGSE